MLTAPLLTQDNLSSDVRTGAGTDVSLTNVELPGLGVPIRYDATTGTGAAIRVSGLCANEAYVFAIGAFDAAGQPLGPIGPTGPEIDALVPLPLPLCFALVAREAVALGAERTATAAALVVYEHIVDVDASGGHALRAARVARASLAEVYAFVDCARILADCSENGGLSFAYAPGILEPRDATGTGDTNSGTARTATTAASGALTAPIQAMQYTKVEILLRTVEVSALTVGQDPETLIDCIIRCYCAAVPLLKLRAGHPRCLVFRALVTLHQALWLVPLGSWDETVREMFSCVVTCVASS